MFVTKNSHSQQDLFTAAIGTPTSNDMHMCSHQASTMLRTLAIFSAFSMSTAASECLPFCMNTPCSQLNGNVEQECTLLPCRFH